MSKADAVSIGAGRKQGKTMLKRIVIPLLVTAVIQAAMFFGVFMINGVFGQMRENTLIMMDELTQNKYQMIQSSMTVSWSYLTSTKEKIDEVVQQTLQERGQDYTDIRSDAELNAAINKAIAPELLNCLRANNTTGVFIVLDGIGVQSRAETYAGVYLCDSDPYGDAADNSDVHVVRGLPPVSRLLNISLDSFWQASFTFDGGAENIDNAFFFTPLNAALEGKLTQAQGGGFWSMPFQINGEEDGAAITYSEPLYNAQGNVYGIIGVDITLDNLALILGRGKVAQSGQGCYLLGVTEDGGKTYRKVSTGGAIYKKFFRAEDTLLAPENVAVNNRTTVRSLRTGDRLRASIYNIKLYAANTVFANQQWALIGLEDEGTLFAFVNNVRVLLLLTTLLAAAYGVAVAWSTGRRIVRPIVRLVNTLQNSNPNDALTLEKTDIAEIDRLAEAISTLNHDVNEAAMRLSKILRISGLPVGVFEVRQDSDMAYCSDGVFTLLGREDLLPRKNLIPKDVCTDMVERAMADKVDDSVYRLKLATGTRYVRIRHIPDQYGIIGTVLDVTNEVEERRRIERERDHDLLTGILNRRAFERQAEALFFQNSSELGVAAMIMLDLDNLKYLNDTYGHDCGDGYIRAFAESLQLFGQENALIARRSGDEFYVLLYGGENVEVVRKRVLQAWQGILERFYKLPDGTPYRMRVSAGVSWYPDNANSLNQLIHYADFAMYKVKRRSKGTLEEFNAKDYSEEAFLISGRDALDRLIDHQLVRFAMQPILSARTGELYGYELLMRTNVRELPDPLTVLRLASAEGKLQHIERLTWFKGLETVRNMLDHRYMPPKVMFFLNSIANQALTPEDEAYVEDTFGALLPRMVIEVTESEKRSTVCTDRKLAFVRHHGGRIAIDDFGTGYNSELALVQIDADIVKLDISFVHGVDTDVNKQELIQHLISYAKQRGIAVLAEGVETRDEMRTLIRYGVDYLQGYYIGHPQFQPMNIDKLLRREIKHIIDGVSDEDD